MFLLLLVDRLKFDKGSFEFNYRILYLKNIPKLHQLKIALIQLAIKTTTKYCN